jgi:hypothetical protein
MGTDQTEAASTTSTAMHAATMHLAGNQVTQDQWFAYSKKLHAAQTALRHLELDTLCGITSQTMTRIQNAIDNEAHRVIGKVT